MYEFPYGAGQQLNLNWIINEIITLHKQLDPDWDLPNFDTAFPYTNLNTLNLDWILRELKAIKDLAPTEDAQLLKMVANALIANTYDAETQYNVDDIVYRDNDNRLYKCITATPAGGEPFDSTKWVEVDVGGVLTDLLNSVVTPPAPYDSNPAMDGTASAGTSTQYARGDHVHPKDTARVPTSRTVNGKALSSNITLNASDIPNDSNVTGDNVDDALNTLDTQANSVEWTPESGDTLLAFILANCTRTKLPFSFVKKGNNTVSDAPTDINTKEFTGLAYGDSDKIIIQTEHYTNNLKAFFKRTIYQNNWWSTWAEYSANIVNTGTPISPIVQSQNVYILKTGKTVNIGLSNIDAVSGTGTWITYFTIDVEYRPPIAIRFLARDLGTNAFYNGRILATGEVQLNIPSGTSANAFFNCCYITLND